MSAPLLTPAGFSVRCLRTEEELSGPWLDLVVAVFGPLGIPRSYFARHWTSGAAGNCPRPPVPPAAPDCPRRHGREQAARGIFVAVDDATGQFVATVRVFRRTLQTRANASAASAK